MKLIALGPSKRFSTAASGRIRLGLEPDPNGFGWFRVHDTSRRLGVELTDWVVAPTGDEEADCRPAWKAERT